MLETSLQPSRRLRGRRNPRVRNHRGHSRPAPLPYHHAQRSQDKPASPGAPLLLRTTAALRTMAMLTTVAAVPTVSTQRRVWRTSVRSPAIPLLRAPARRQAVSVSVCCANQSITRCRGTRSCERCRRDRLPTPMSQSHASHRRRRRRGRAIAGVSTPTVAHLAAIELLGPMRRRCRPVTGRLPSCSAPSTRALRRKPTDNVRCNVAERPNLRRRPNSIVCVPFSKRAANFLTRRRLQAPAGQTAPAPLRVLPAAPEPPVHRRLSGPLMSNAYSAPPTLIRRTCRHRSSSRIAPTGSDHNRVLLDRILLDRQPADVTPLDQDQARSRRLLLAHCRRHPMLENFNKSSMYLPRHRDPPTAACNESSRRRPCSTSATRSRRRRPSNAPLHPRQSLPPMPVSLRLLHQQR